MWIICEDKNQDCEDIVGVFVESMNVEKIEWTSVFEDALRLTEKDSLGLDEWALIMEAYQELEESVELPRIHRIN